MYIYIFPNIGGPLSTKLKSIVVESGYYLSEEIDGNESFFIGFMNSFPEEIPIEKRICLVTPDMKIPSKDILAFCTNRFKLVHDRRKKLVKFLSNQKSLIPTAVTC